jgi:hypothetical protein
MSEEWKQHYFRMGEKAEQPAFNNNVFPDTFPMKTSATKTISKKTVKSVFSLKKSDIKALLYTRELLRRKAEKAEEKDRAHDIKSVNQSKYIVKIDSIEAYLIKVLSLTEEALHINKIITKIEELGWRTSSTYHKYSQVYNALHTNDYMFLRTARATFKLREGFRGRKPEKEERVVRERFDNTITIKDIAASITKRYQSEKGIWPAKVHFIMEHMGFKCAYSSVYRAMQCDDFAKNGSWYTLKNDVHNAPQEVSCR